MALNNWKEGKQFDGLCLFILFPSFCFVALCLVLLCEGGLTRDRRQAPLDNSYQPPFLVNTPAPPQNSYNPPISFGEFSKAEPAVAIHSSPHLQSTNNNEAFGLQVLGDSHSKAISYNPVQAINKAPASEIQSKPSSPAKEKDNKNDEYVVYYYYYYDNDTSPNTNLSLSFDDIPSLESYDEDRISKEKNSLGNANSHPIVSDSVIAGGNRLSPELSDTSGSSQARSLSGNDKESVISPDRIYKNSDDIYASTNKPISNVFRYGANEVPKYPVVPNFIIADTTTVAKPTDVVTPLPVSAAHATTQSSSFNSQFSNVGNNEEDVSNNVLDSALESKSFEDKSGGEDSITTTARAETTTIETTTITTTEKSSRRRPPIANGRRRFNASPSSFSSTRTRAPSRDTSSSTTSTTTSTSSTPTRRTFQGSNRVRSRPSVGGNRGRTRTTESNNIVSPSSEATTVSTTTARSRFTSAPRRFQSSRSRSQTSSTTSTTRSPTSSSSSPVRSRPTSRRPSSNLLSRSRPARPGFPRSRPAAEPEVPETTTPAPEETSPSVSSEEESPEKELTSEEEEEESAEPTTTEASRFSALFKPRNRSALGNRPRPVIGNRPPRS